MFSRTSAAAVCAVLIGMFYLVTIREGHEWGDDFSMYILHARNVAEGHPYADTGYIYNPSNPAVGPRTYPPGFPVLLAPVVTLFGLNLWPMKVVVVGFFVGSLLLMILLFRTALPAPYLTALVVIIGLNPFFWEFKDQVVSDIPFLFFALLSLHLFRQAEERNASRRRRTIFAVLSGIAAYACYATRVLALVLVPCFIAHDLIRYRRISVNAVLASSILVGLAGVQYVFWIHDASYLDQVTTPIAAAEHNIVYYLRSLSDLWENGYSESIRRGTFLGVAAVAVFGYVKSLRTDAGVLHLFPLMYLTPVILWPSFQGLRLLIPVVPFQFYYCLVGILRIDATVERRWGMRKVVLMVFLAAVVPSYAVRYSTLQFGRIAQGINKRETVELFEFVKGSTAPSDVFVFSRPRALVLFTGRRASAPYGAADPCRLWQYMREIRATYVITGPDIYPLNVNAFYLRSFVSQFRSAFRQVMANQDLAVYRVERNPCSPGHFSPW